MSVFKWWTIRPTLIDLNPVELKYYPFMISLNKCTGSCNVLSQNTCVPKEAKDISFKVFDMITNRNEGKAKTEHISCDCKYKFNSTVCNASQKWNNKTCQYECKNCRTCKKDYSCNPNTYICENSNYLKITAVTECDEIISVMDCINKVDKCYEYCFN